VEVVGDHPVIANNRRFAVFYSTVFGEGFFHDIEAVHGDNVYSFTDVKALGEARMVCVEKGEDILMRPLVSLIYLNAVLYQFKWINHKGYAIEKLAMADLIEHISVKSIFIGLRDDVPSLGCAFVAVV